MSKNYKLEKSNKQNKNICKNVTFIIYSNWYLYKIIHKIAFSTFENITIILELRKKFQCVYACE